MGSDITWELDAGMTGGGSGEVGVVKTFADQAEASADAAAASAVSAGTSASTAAASEAVVLAAASAANASSAAADASETAAATSAANAATSATNAATSASNAATSASNAATSASSASTSASSASTSATNAAASAANAAAAEAATEALYDSFDDRYLGAYASAPTTDNDGDPLTTGALYFDTVSDAMQVWDGSAWQAAYASLSGALIAVNNLSDLTNPAAAADNLGLGTGDSPTFAGATLTGDLTITDKIIHAGDTNTAIRFPAADTWTVETAGSEALRVTSTGNVGIGTTSPTSALTVSGRIETVDGADIDMDGSASGHLRLDGAGYGAAIALNAQGANFYTNSASRDLIFGVNETEVMRVTNGSVGIGTNDPSSPLQISSTSSARLLLTNPTFVNDDQSSANISYEAGDSSFAIQGRTSGGVFKANWMKMFTNTSGQVTDHVWYTGASAERMRIDSSGNVGIGVNTPNTLFHVEGGRTTLSANNEKYALQVNKTSVFDGPYIGSDGANILCFSDSAGTERMRIDSSGNLLHGLSSASAVNGSIVSTRFALGQTNIDNAGRRNWEMIKEVATLGSMGFRVSTANNTAPSSQVVQFLADGSIISSGDVTAYSDERLKTDIETLDGSKVYEMRGVSFTKGERAGSGVIAQELQKIAPELVDDSGEYLSVAYGNLVGYLIEAVKSLNERVKQLEEQGGASD